MRTQIEAQRRTLNELLDSNDIAPGDLAMAFGELGQLYLLYDLSSAAEAALRNASALSPREPRWAYLLGSLFRLDNRLDLAAQAYERVLALGSRDPATLIHLGNVHLRREAASDAEPLFAKPSRSPASMPPATMGWVESMLYAASGPRP